MQSSRKQTLIDQLIIRGDKALRTVFGQATTAHRPSPADTISTDDQLSTDEKKHSAGLMRVNHSGEVCAQALYQGQALTARLDKTRTAMENAANEEEDHLAWCVARLKEFDSHTSVFNPLWYGMSFGLGAIAGIAGDKISLGFVAATEKQVCQHLDDHLHQLPVIDKKSRAIVEQMRKDEAQHADNALDAGGYDFPPPVKTAMAIVAKVMTKTSYKI